MIYDIHGKPYVIAKPNPLMSQQTLWRKVGNYTFYNRVGKSETIFDKKVSVPKTEKPADPVIVQSLPQQDAPVPGTVEVWCLPAHYKEYTDPLYGETFKKMRYNKKFMFEALIGQNHDLKLVLWTNTKAVSVGSVLFPRTRDKRWWRVENVTADDGGYLLHCVISDYCPNFSE